MPESFRVLMCLGQVRAVAASKIPVLLLWGKYDTAVPFKPNYSRYKVTRAPR